MGNLYIKPISEGEDSGYSIKYARGQGVDGVKHRKQETAIELAKRVGYRPTRSGQEH
jgi:hypothetical protein